MKTLGIDPGYERCGIAIIEKKSGTKETVIYSDCIRTSAKDSFAKRLHQLGESLETVIRLYQPDVVAIEELYFAKNSKTALSVAEARGVIQYIATNNKLSVYEYHPNKIKIAITGDGRADKTAIAFMIPKLITYDTHKKIDDEMDALAVALTHIAHSKQ